VKTEIPVLNEMLSLNRDELSLRALMGPMGARDELDHEKLSAEDRAEFRTAG
jgi:hypothetical protein